MKELYPSAKIYGMTDKEFWEDDPQLYWSSLIYYSKKREMENEHKNQCMWLQGMYIYEALVVAIGNSFGDKKAKRLAYSEKPYELSKNNKKEGIMSEPDKIVTNDFNYWARLV